MWRLLEDGSYLNLLIARISLTNDRRSFTESPLHKKPYKRPLRPCPLTSTAHYHRPPDPGMRAGTLPAKHCPHCPLSARIGTSLFRLRLIPCCFYFGMSFFWGKHGLNGLCFPILDPYPFSRNTNTFPKISFAICDL